MSGLLAAILAGFLFGTGIFLVLSREPIKLILGLSLVSYAVNTLLFTASTLRRGLPPIIQDKTTFAGEIGQFVDPMPQALILTAIIISFGIIAFLLTLVNRRNTLTETIVADDPDAITKVVNDPFGTHEDAGSDMDPDPEDFEWLEDTLSERLMNNHQGRAESA